MFTNQEKQAVRDLIREHLCNPARRAAREARNQYILEIMSAAARGDEVDRDAADWLKRLRELCLPHMEVYEKEGIAGWYRREENRLVALTGERR